ncbi:hypothetical protein C8Q77DRAFT_1070112 [Trametes polyzona]|nr:hypothetical protein C8Q77DRAFT_1070112 [Trametes polyzona]
MATLDLTDDSETFNADEWIGKNHVFSAAQLPLCVLDAHRKAIKLGPEDRSTFIPDHTLPASTFIAIWFPVRSCSILQVKGNEWFTPDPPTHALELLTLHVIPPSQTLDALLEQSGQAWLNGTLSIRDPHFHHGKEHFPLNALRLWRELSQMAEAQAEWKGCLSWLSATAMDGIDEHIKASMDSVDYTDTYFPACVRNSHWVAFHVNFKERSLEYGNSLTGTIYGRAPHAKLPRKWKASADTGEEVPEPPKHAKAERIT